MPSSTRSPSMSTTRRCAKTASSCSTKSAKPLARWRIFRRLRLEATELSAHRAVLSLPATQGDTIMVIGIGHLQPIVALIAGILILIMPRLLNFIVAAYLIVIGVIGLGLI